MGCKCSKRLARYVKPSAPKSSNEAKTREGENGDDRDVAVQETQAEGDGLEMDGVQLEETQTDNAAEISDEYKQVRDEEKEFIQKHDTPEADIYYLIDLQWLSQWRNFAFKDGQQPGPIDNSRLVDEQTGVPKIGLELKDDYRGVNLTLWNFWHGRYGGGPLVKRRSLDLYAPEPEAPQPKKVAKAKADESSAAVTPARVVHTFPLRLAMTTPPQAVMVSKGLAGLFEPSSVANEPVYACQYPAEMVFVNVYNLGSDDLGQMINSFSTINDSVMVGGVFHAGIEIYGFEWSFGRTLEGTGVWRTLPRMENGHRYRGTMPLGATKLSIDQVLELMQRLGDEWPGSDYDLLRRNCLSFCNALCTELGVRHIPRWIDRAPRTASAVLDTTSILGCTSREK